MKKFSHTTFYMEPTRTSPKTSNLILGVVMEGRFFAVITGIVAMLAVLGPVNASVDANASDRWKERINQQLISVSILNYVNSFDAALKKKSGPYRELSSTERSMLCDIYSAYWAGALPRQVRATKQIKESNSVYTYHSEPYAEPSDRELFEKNLAALLGKARAENFLKSYEDVIDEETRGWGKRSATIIVKWNPTDVIVTEKFDAKNQEQTAVLRFSPGAELTTRYSWLEFPFI